MILKKFLLGFIQITIFTCHSNFFIDSAYADINKCNLNSNYNESDLGKYLLGPGDIININIFSNKDISGNYEILNDGYISMPIIGSIKINGLTLEKATIEIENKLEKQLYAAALEITLKSSRPLSVSIIGKIKRPGVYKLQKNIFDEEINRFQPYASLPRLVDAIELAGGVSQDADIKNICLIRKRSNKQDDNYYLNFNLLDLLSNGNQINNPYLFDEDIIKIGKIDFNKKEKSTKFLNSTLVPEYISINIIGDVNNPGNKKIKNNSYLIDAISAAEGISLGNPKGYAEIIRSDDNGKIKRIRYQLNLKSKKAYKNIEIFNGDTIFISSNKIRKSGLFLKTLTEPLFHLFRIIEINENIKN